MTIHNLSTYTFTTEELELLNKGLSYAPTIQTSQQQQIQLLKQYDEFAKSVRSTFMQHSKKSSKVTITLNPPQSANIYRPMKFIPKEHRQYATDYYSEIHHVEYYIEQTKRNVNDELPQILHQTNRATNNEQKTIAILKKSRTKITIKPADKNLGTVILDTDDYIKQCMTVLSDTNTYRQAQSFPCRQIHTELTNILVHFKPQLDSTNNKLYDYLQPKTDRPTPQFYGLPKVHKKFDHLPPVRPIISHCDSMLNPTARLLDHCLQPLTKSYPDYIENSAALSLILQDLHVPKSSFLVSIDVESLYPSIPQTSCLNVVYDQMYKYRHLLLLDPNFLIRLLDKNINYNYFQYGALTFQQIRGTAMGAAFSPTIANIYMSVTLQKFLKTRQLKPLLLKRYIDDIILIWTHSKETLVEFLSALNHFHPSLHFTFSLSKVSTDFLDLTIYKGPNFSDTNTLDTKTYQKERNLYQYLYFTSNHPHSQHKSIITGECVRYVRTNTTRESYDCMLALFKERLKRRNYPEAFINKALCSVKYEDRQRHLHKSVPTTSFMLRPIFKCVPPPKFNYLKQIILQDYSQLHLPSPRFVTLGHKTLRKELVRTKLQATDEQIMDMLFSLPVCNSTSNVHVNTGILPVVKYANVKTQPCRHSRCVTCAHLNCKPNFTSTKTGISYPLRHNFTCTSRNIIYLITCTRCKKQYVGLTMQQLNVRINHHRTNIFNHTQTYISNHFNFPDHSISHLSIQIIDTPTSGPNMLQELQHLKDIG